MKTTRKKPPSQNDRVLAALSRAGARGITSVDFAAPHVVDGRAPIMRVAARIHDLRELGHEIERVGLRQGVAVYRLQPRRRRLGMKSGLRGAAPRRGPKAG